MSKLTIVSLPPRKAYKASKRSFKRSKPKRRKKGALTLLKAELWHLTRIEASKLYEHSCYTCGVPLRWGSSVMQLGHFIPRSETSQELHFDLKNLRWQCRICNQFHNGRWPTFEARLIREHGQEYVDELKRRNEQTKGTTYPLSWYQERIAYYQNKLN